MMTAFPNAPSRSRAAPRCARPRAVLASARCLRKSLISGMTKDGSRSRLSNHAPVSLLPASLLPLASSRGLPRWARSASLRERSAPFEVPPDAGRPGGSLVTKHGAPNAPPLLNHCAFPVIWVYTSAVVKIRVHMFTSGYMHGEHTDQYAMSHRRPSRRGGGASGRAPAGDRTPTYRHRQPPAGVRP